MQALSRLEAAAVPDRGAARRGARGGGGGLGGGAAGRPRVRLERDRAELGSEARRPRRRGQGASGRPTPRWPRRLVKVMERVRRMDTGGQRGGGRTASEPGPCRHRRATPNRMACGPGEEERRVRTSAAEFDAIIRQLKRRMGGDRRTGGSPSMAGLTVLRPAEGGRGAHRGTWQHRIQKLERAREEAGPLAAETRRGRAADRAPPRLATAVGGAPSPAPLATRPTPLVGGGRRGRLQPTRRRCRRDRLGPPRRAGRTSRGGPSGTAAPPAIGTARYGLSGISCQRT